MAAVQHSPTVPTPVVPCTELKGSLPNVKIDEAVDSIAISENCISCLEHLQQDALTSDALWKDCLAITGHQRTFYTSGSILTAWKELASRCKPHNFQLVPHTAQVFKLGPQPAWITAAFSFQTEGKQAGFCSGMINIVPDDTGEYKIWSFCTMLEALKDVEQGNPDSLPDPSFAPAANLDDGGEIDCVIVGGGMAGLCAAGRLHSLRIPYVVVERNANVGDNWTKRYDSVRLHLANSYSEMPFKRVYTDKPFYLSKHDLAEGMQSYTDMHNIQVWLSSSVDSARWDEKNRSWTVGISREGQKKTLKVKHLIMAIGGGVDKPSVPQYDDREKFEGTVVHSADWKNADGFKGKKAILVGSGNSAFDVAQDLVDGGLASTTMLQRSVTHTMTAAHFRELLKPLYNSQMDLNIADRIVMTRPYAVGRLTMMAAASALQAMQPTNYEYLTTAGFRYSTHPDYFAGVVERLGGHHMDMGGFSLIEKGQVKVISGVLPTAYTEKGLRLQDGTELEADVIVFCTGFRNNLRQSVSDVVGPETAAQLDDFWGVDAEGELRGLAKPINHPGIWYFGGGTAHARFVSRFLALQILADVRGVPFEPYTAKP